MGDRQEQAVSRAQSHGLFDALDQQPALSPPTTA
jgi:hypothetical protein